MGSSDREDTGSSHIGRARIGSHTEFTAPSPTRAGRSAWPPAGGETDRGRPTRRVTCWVWLASLALASGAAFAEVQTFENTSPIELLSGAAKLYPSEIEVSGITGSVTDVNVTLHDVSHDFPHDIDVLLVGPAGEGVILMSDVPGDILHCGVEVSNLELTFDDEAATGIPPDSPLASGTYRPTDDDGTDCFSNDVDEFPDPATPPTGTTLAQFEGVNANGTWRLFVVDDRVKEFGSIAGGWSLELTTVELCPDGESLVEFDADVGEISEYVVPPGVQALRITAAGGSGGAESVGAGGPGAVLTGVVPVLGGEELRVLEGGAGASGFCTGGGGGSFVGVGVNFTAFSADNLLVVAAGGGGAGSAGHGGAGGALNGGDGGGARGGGGGKGSNGGAAGHKGFAGEGGGAATGDHGASGTGDLSAGGGGAGGNGGNANTAEGGAAAVKGGAGGGGTTCPGGFGGGGAGESGGGGGGGYAGGGGGGNASGGGGGSSFFADDVTERTATATNDGDGYVYFCEIASLAVSPVALAADPEPASLSDGNGVFEPGERVEVAPAWRNDDTFVLSLDGTASGFTGPGDADYELVLPPTADYGNVAPDAVGSCDPCYEMEVVPQGDSRPSLHWDATFEETLSTGTTQDWTLHLGDSFTDVPRTSLFYGAVETLLHSGVTAGCGAGVYCPAAPVSRGQMPAFVLRALGAPPPPACSEGDERFVDVPFDSLFCPWIEELARQGVVAGCGDDAYCPAAAVTRAQMAVFLLRTLLGGDYEPPECTGLFDDVPCTSLFAAWIEELSRQEITGGCGLAPPRYCPAQPVTRNQMAVFLTRTFGLALYGP